MCGGGGGGDGQFLAHTLFYLVHLFGFQDLKKILIGHSFLAFTPYRNFLKSISMWCTISCFVFFQPYPYPPLHHILMIHP